MFFGRLQQSAAAAPILETAWCVQMAGATARSWPDRIRDSLKEAWAVGKDSVRQFGDNDGMHMSAGVAFYALLSMFPLVMLLVSVSGFFFEPEEASDWLVERLGDRLPVTEEFLAPALDGVVLIRGPMAVVGMVGVILGSMTVFGAIVRSINRAWGIHRKGARSFLRFSSSAASWCSTRFFQTQR
jgi:membrane protein